MNMGSKIVRGSMAVLAILTVPLIYAGAVSASQAPAQAPSSNAPSSLGPGGLPPAQPPAGFGIGRLPPDAKAAAAPHTMAPYFEPATNGPKPPDVDGFLQR